MRLVCLYLATCIARAGGLTVDSDRITAEQVMQALRMALVSVPGSEFELIDFSRFPAPPGELIFGRNGLGYSGMAAPRVPVVWRGRLQIEPRRSLPFWAKVRVFVSRPAVMTAEALAAGKPIERGQLKLENLKFFPFGPSPVATIDQAEGRVPRRSLRADEVLRAEWLEAPRDIERGQSVAVAVERGGAILKFQGVALSAGRAGDAILVRNPESKRQFRARVVDGKSVIVDETLGLDSAARVRRRAGGS